MSPSRRQHTIPRFYLNQFLKPGWVYQRGSLCPRRVNHAENEAVRSWYYASSFDDSKFSLDGTIAQVEGVLNPVYKEFLTENLELTSNRKRMFSYFIAHLAARVPAQIEESASFVLNAYEEVDKMLTQQAKALSKNRGELEAAAAAASGDRSSEPKYNPTTGGYTYLGSAWNKELETLRRDVNSGKAMIEQSISFILGLMRFIMDMNWIFFDAPPGGFFVTSDRPVYLTRLDGSRLGAGWGNPDVVASFPISPQRCLVMHRLKSGKVWGHKEASPEELDYLNDRALASALKTIYSGQKYGPAEKWMRI